MKLFRKNNISPSGFIRQSYTSGFFKRSLMTLLTVSVSASTFSSQKAFAESALQEQTSYQLKRTLNTPNSVQFSLSKNVYRPESYQANYEVQVPYEDQETYTVDVPYQVQVPYQDTETYYEQEYQCHNEIRYKQECHPETVCNRLMKSTDSQGQQFSLMDHGGRPGEPGRDPGHPGRPGGPDRPHEPPGGPMPPPHRPPPPRPPEPPMPPPQPPACHVETRCNNVPYTQQICGYVNVPKTRWVTRYRTETRYNTETRTRTVTRYRTETRCCETRTREVFDHQYAFNVTVKLPQADLLESDLESLQFSLEGTEAAPHISYSAINTVYDYQVVKQEITGANAYIELSITPKYNRSNAGYTALSNFSVKKQGTTSVLIFQDAIVSSHIRSRYAVKISDTKNNVLASGQTVNVGQNQVVLVLDKDISGRGPAVVEIAVHREGDLIKDRILDFTTFQGVVIK